jgi:integrase/recombinase XerD
VLRVQSLLSYGHKLGYMPFNAGVTIKIRPDQSRGQLAKRIMPEVDVQLLIRAARSARDWVMLETLYAGGPRISELGLSWADVIERDAKVQLSVTGKGGRTRQVLLPTIVSASLLNLRGDAGANDPVFASHKGGRRLTERTVGYMLKRTAKRAGIADTVSPHWLRHAHGSHALDRGATLAEVQSTLGTRTSPRRAAICTRGPTRRAG